MSDLIISVSGLRGVVGESLTPEIAVRYATAFAATLPPGPIVLSYDGRESGPMFLSALSDGLTKLGRDVLNFWCEATPTTGVLVRQYAAAGGIQISASHNPPEYNGLKLFSALGRVIPAENGQRVLQAYRSESPVPDRNLKIGKLRSGATDHLPSEHANLVTKVINTSAIQEKQFRVLLDSNGGAGRFVAEELFLALRCWFRLEGSDELGTFLHPPEPTAENLASILPRVVENQCDVGFCQDPDADRLAVIDEKGRYLGEEYTLAICVDHMLRQRPGPVVTNCSTSRMTEDLAKKYGVPFYRSAVGEANVVDAMLKHHAVLGGEGNGGVIDPRVVLVRDSFTAMGMILDAMAARNLPVSELADELPRYEICKTKITLPPEKLAAGYAALMKHFHDAKGDKLDGLRLDWPGKWLLVRPSNTEPIVRAIAEAPTASEAKRLCEEAATALRAI